MSLRRMLVGAAAMAGLAIGAIGGAAPAFASEGDGVIQDGEFIVWRDCGFTGPIYDFASVKYDYTGFIFINDVQPVNDRGSSVANYSGVNQVNAYYHAYFGGPRLIVNPRGSINLCGGPFDNQLSSHHF